MILSRGCGARRRELTDEQKEKVRRSLKAMYVGPSATDEPFSRQLNAARMSAMRVLLDTNVLIDLYTQRRPRATSPRNCW